MTSPTKLILAIAAVAVVAGGGATWWAAAHRPAPVTQPAKSETQLQIDAARVIVRQRLRDPDSARFRKASVTTVTLNSGEHIRIVCGYVNAKNGFGGYTGDKVWWLFHLWDGSEDVCFDKLEGCAQTLFGGPSGAESCATSLGP